MVITFATVECAIQLIFQRMTQVLMVVMISHMVLNLKGSNAQAQGQSVSNNPTPDSVMIRKRDHQAPISLDTWLIEPGKMSSVVGTSGNDLVHTLLDC